MEILGQERGRRVMRMCGAEQRVKVIEAFAKFGCSAADAVV